jgi:hypothetical protein
MLAYNVNKTWPVGLGASSAHAACARCDHIHYTVIVNKYRLIMPSHLSTRLSLCTVVVQRIPLTALSL